MNVDIYISERKGNRSIRIPWLPEEINFKSGGTIRITYDIMNKGPVEVPIGSGLCGYSWESVFPGKLRNDNSMMRGSWKDPATYHNILEDWKAKGTPLRIIVTGYPINKDVILDDYEGAATGAFGDITYDVSFIEDRDITITTPKAEKTNSTPKRQADRTTSYTVKKGDNLWKIAEKELKKGSRHTEIYGLNKEIIESTAKKHGKKSSDNGHWIYPGTVLKLPQ